MPLSPAQSPILVKIEMDSSLTLSHVADIPSGDIFSAAVVPEVATEVKVKLQGADHSTAASIFSEFGSSEVAGEALDAPFDIESILAAQSDISQSIAEFMIPPPRVDVGGDDLKLFDASPIPSAAQADVKFLAENPYASLRWTALITKLGDAESHWPPAFVRNVLQSCLRVYRRSPNVWMLYIKHLWDSRDLALAMKQFQAALHLCPHIDLFRVYLKCIRVIFQDKFQDASARELLRHAHEFAVEKVGMDVYSLPIWQEYISLLKDLNLETEARTAYKRCIGIPIADVERVKNDWDDFERTRKLQNKGEVITKAILELVRTSKTYSADRVQMAISTGNISTSRALFSNFSAPCPDSVDGQVDGWDAESYHAALNNWMRFIDAEKKSSENNEEQRRPRIMLALQHCVMSMQHSAAAWYHLVSFALAKENNDFKAAAALLQDAVITVPRCLALRLMYCDFLEEHGDIANSLKVHEANTRLCTSAVAWVHYLSFCRRAVGISSFRAAFITCKRSGFCNALIWAFAANLEWRMNRCPDVARMLFEAGMKQFSNDTDFVLEYTQFLDVTGCDDDARSLFESVVGRPGLKPEELRLVWESYLAFERSRGNMLRSLDVQRRLQSSFADGDNALADVSFIQRVDLYSVGRLHSLKPLSSQELFLVTPKVIASQHVAVVPSEKSVSLLPVPPRQDLPPMPQILNDFLVRLPSEPVTGLQGIDTIMQTIMGIKAPAMIQRPAREQLQWPAQEARIKITSNKRPRGADNGSDNEDDVRQMPKGDLYRQQTHQRSKIN